MSVASDDDGRVTTRTVERDSHARSSELPPGTVIGEYTIEALIGRGGMGAVYSARQPLIGKRVAIKLLLDALPDDPSVVRRFVDEARAVNKIGHPNIVDIFSFGRLPDNRLYFVMELLPGGTLRDRLVRGPLTPSEAERYVTQICNALGAAHAEQIVHRDLKPENIWITTPRHGEPYIKLLDFGIAKLAESQAPGPATVTGIVMGTPHFMSPEQCQGGYVDHRTDIYALGVILYELFAGRLPFEGNSAVEVLMQHMSARPARPSEFRALSAGLDALILACLEKSPEARPQSTAELLARFQAALREPGLQLGAAGPRSEAPSLRLPSSDALSSDALRPLAATEHASTLAPADAPPAPPAEPIDPTPAIPDAPALRTTGRGRVFVLAALVLIAAAAGIYLLHSPAERRVARPSATEPQPAGAVIQDTPAVRAIQGAAPTAAATLPSDPDPAPAAAASETIAPPAHPQARLRSERSEQTTNNDKRVRSRVEKAGLVTHNPF
jgi:serine/threonine protein kinase